jgi:hypothetical protein
MEGLLGIRKALEKGTSRTNFCPPGLSAPRGDSSNDIEISASKKIDTQKVRSTLQSVRTDLFKNGLALLESLWHLGTLFPQRAPRKPNSHPHNKANTSGLYILLNLYLLLCIEFRMRCF